MAEERDVEIGRHRAALRVRVGLTQAELAEKAGVGIATVNRAEAGLPINESSLRAISGALGLPARDYIEPDGYVAPAAPVTAESTR